MRFRSMAATAALALSLAVAGCSGSSTASPAPTVVSSVPSIAGSTVLAVPSTPKTSPAKPTSKAPTGSTSTSGPKTTSPAKTTPTTKATPTIVQNTLPTKIVNTIPKRKAITVAACKSTSGGWEATGTAANATAKKVDYVITIFFTTDKATVQDFAVAKLSVPAKTTAKWSAAKKFKASQPTLCVLRAVA